MIGVVFRVMWASFWRDRGALAMSLLLPVAVFLVFATIFGGASGENVRISVVAVDEQQSPASKRLITALGTDPSLRLRPASSAIEAGQLVAAGAADVGLVIRSAGRPVAEMAGDGEAPLAIVVDPVREVAARILAGQIQRAYFNALPDLALRSVADLLGQGFITFTPAQRDSLDQRFAELAADVAAGGRDQAEGPFEGLMVRERPAGTGLATSHVAYYAGAIAILFLLFSAVHGALSMLEERDTGLLDRMLAGPGGMSAIVGGKFLFLVVQGVAQVAVIFVVAWLLYRVPLPSRLAEFLAVTASAAIAAAGLALLLTTLAGSRRQAQTVANIAILLISAIGGSMVPRFLMPPALQAVGWFTPTTWAIEAYSGLFWRGQPLGEILLPMLLLLATGIGALLLARLLARRAEQL